MYTYQASAFHGSIVVIDDATGESVTDEQREAILKRLNEADKATNDGNGPVDLIPK